MTPTPTPTTKRAHNQQNTCHVARIMVNLPHGKERGMYASDGRSVTRSLKNAWVEPDPTPTRETELSLRSKVGKQGILCHQSGGFATTHTGGCTDENRESLWRVDEYAFPVARCELIKIGTLDQSAVSPRYRHVHYTCEIVIWQQPGDVCTTVGHEVAVREDYHYDLL